MLMTKNLLIPRKNMIIERQANADFLNAKTVGDLCRIIICVIDGGIINEG
jgi:hypothetical protein